MGSVIAVAVPMPHPPKPRPKKGRSGQAAAAAYVGERPGGPLVVSYTFAEYAVRAYDDDRPPGGSWL